MLVYTLRIETNMSLLRAGDSPQDEIHFMRVEKLVNLEPIGLGARVLRMLKSKRLED